MIVKRIRQLTNLTQKEFCLKYGIPLKTLQNWEATQGTVSARECPLYVTLLLEKALRSDYPALLKFIEANIDDTHLAAINYAKNKIKKSKLNSFVKDVVLYGSTARGQAKRTSDVDLLLVLDESIKKLNSYNDLISKLKGNISSDDFSIPEADLHVVFGNNWKNNKDAYYQNIKKEGFSIWN